MTDRIEHRGKDGEGHYIDENIALGHRLLQTNKKVTGEQPLFNKDKDIIVVSDSVINNYKELKKELEEMGMFSPEYKRPIPAYAKRIGVVTASTQNGDTT